MTLQNMKVLNGHWSAWCGDVSEFVWCGVCFRGHVQQQLLAGAHNRSQDRPHPNQHNKWIVRQVHAHFTHTQLTQIPNHIVHNTAHSYTTSRQQQTRNTKTNNHHPTTNTYTKEEGKNAETTTSKRGKAKKHTKKQRAGKSGKAKEKGL